MREAPHFTKYIAMTNDLGTPKMIPDKLNEP